MRYGRGNGTKRLAHRSSLAGFAIAAGIWLQLLSGPCAAQLPPCVGDCSVDRQVTVDELVVGVNIALGVSPVSACPAFDPNNTGTVTIDKLVEAVDNALLGCPPRTPIATPTPTPVISPPPPQSPTPVIEFSEARECQRCHARQFDEWRTSPHAYTGISPTFWSLMAAGQNGAGAGAINSDGVAIGGAVGNFCAPCHGPLAYVGATGSLGGNNGGLGNVAPEFPLVCANRLLSEGVAVPCTGGNAAEVCSVAGQAPQTSAACVQFEGRSCINAPPAVAGSPFPRRVIPCGGDSECQGLGLGCANDDCGPCIIAPSTAFFSPLGQEGINCETCHNLQQNFRRSCQLFRNSDSVATFSYELASRTRNDGRLRLGPFPIGPNGSGRPNDQIPPALNPFHASTAVGSPFLVPYNQTDRPNGRPNPNPMPFVIRRTELTCGELPYCSATPPVSPNGLCEGGPFMGMACMSDANCGGCGPVAGSPELGRRCSGAAIGLPCLTSSDCGSPSDQNMSLLDRGVEQGTIGPLTGQLLADGTRGIDRADGDFFRSGTMCGTCHDVRPPFINSVLRSCQRQKTQVCGVDDDCRGLNIGCPGNDCGPCVAENNTGIAGNPPGDPRNTGYRRVENLFSEWQVSLYNHPELTFCHGDSFKACTNDADCGADGPCNVRSPYGRVVTCQDCHMSKFPSVPLIAQDGTVTPPNDLYAQDLVALQGSQSDTSVPLPLRRVSTHFMSGVDLPLVPFPGQSTQATRRQQLVNSAFRISLDQTPASAQAGDKFGVEVEIENVGVGHRVPAGFSHERQYWVQLYVQDAGALGALDPFDPAAPCNLQHVVATGADDTRDPAGAAALADAGCVYRSGFILDKAHPETGELQPDGSLRDEDPEDFFVVAGTQMRGLAGIPRNERIEVRPGAKGRALAVQNICAKATEEAYQAGISDGTGIDPGTDPSFPHQVRFCNAANTPGRAPGFTPPGFGNPACMENGADLGPCVQEIELSDGNERGRCARNLTKAECQSDEECGSDGPCLFRCAGLPDLQCCDPAQSTECAAYYTAIGEQPCMLKPQVCAGGSNSGSPCTADAQCPGQGATCGNVGPCNVESRGIVNFQNAFRNTVNGVCVDPEKPRDANLNPIPFMPPVACGTNLSCTLRGLKGPSGKGAVCLINGECENGGNPCTNYTSEKDCGGGACNVERNTQLNGRASESVFIQNHPFNFNSLPPFQPRDFTYEFEIPARFSGRQLVVAARIMNRHFPMRFLRNLIGTQVIKPPFIVEAQGTPGMPGQCLESRQIDIDCYVQPLAILGNAQAGGFVPPNQQTRTTRVTVQ